jgi:hypothetical protein
VAVVLVLVADPAKAQVLVPCQLYGLHRLFRVAAVVVLLADPAEAQVLVPHQLRQQFPVAVADDLAVVGGNPGVLTWLNQTQRLSTLLTLLRRAW